MKIQTVLLGLLLPITMGCEMPLSSDQEALSRSGEIVIEDFDRFNPLDWRIVNDSVMGGISKSSLMFNNDETALFKGDVSLKNNGGFASIRAYYGTGLEGIKKIVVRVKGDGQVYNFRVRTAEAYWASYSVRFQTIKDEWVEFDFNLSDFTPTYRGYNLYDMPNLDELEITGIGIMIADKQEGQFELSLDWVIAQY